MQRKTFKQFMEDAPANNVGSGNIASAGIPNESKPLNWAEPGVKKKKKSVMLRRKRPNG